MRSRLILFTLATLALAHGDHDEHVDPSASYAELHMAQEVGLDPSSTRLKC